MISLAGVSVTFGRHQVLRDLQLEIAAGERVALLGLNGCGKTTLLRTVLGVQQCAGTVRVNGTVMAPDSIQARSAIGYVPQRAPAFSGTLQSMVSFYARLREIPLERVHERARSLGLDLTAHSHKALGELSGGMAQKVLLGLALAAEPLVLILDEPTASLDPAARRDFIDMLRRVPAGTTVVLASHRMTEVEAVAQRALVLHEGHFVLDGPIEVLAGRAESRGDEPPAPLRALGLATEELWTRAPTIEDMLQNLLRAS